MPNFRVHRILGLIVGFFVFTLVFVTTLFTTFSIGNAFFVGFIAFASTVIGSVVPDIDLSHSTKSLKYASKPYRGLVKFIKGVFIFIAFLMILNFSQVISAVGLFLVLLGVIAGVFIFSKIPDILHSMMPKHRGLTHDLLPWVFFAIVGTIALRDLFVELGATNIAVEYLPPAIAPTLALGAMCHIGLDSVVSLWKKIKNSMPISRQNDDIIS